MSPVDRSGAEPDDLIGYGGWGEAFFARAVTVERVLRGVGVMAERPIDVGPIGVGPGRIAKARARGHVGTPTGRRVSRKPVRFDVDLPVEVELEVDLGVDTHRFAASLDVPLHLTAHARRDLSIVLDIRPPHARDLSVRLRALSRRAAIVQHAANVEGELRRFVARYVEREIDEPHVVAARTIDVAGAIEGAFEALAPVRSIPSDDPDVAPVVALHEAAPSAGTTLGPPEPGAVAGGAATAADHVP